MPTAAELVEAYDELEQELELDNSLVYTDCTQELRKMAQDYINENVNDISTKSNIPGALCFNTTFKTGVDIQILLKHSGVVYTIILAVTHARLKLLGKEEENRQSNNSE